jgi:hypothetical protein
MEFITRFPVEIVFTFIVDATRFPVLMKLVGERLWMEFWTVQEEVVNVDATKEFATMELATSKVFVWMAPVKRLPFGFTIAVELRLNCETPSAFMDDATKRADVLIPSVAVRAVVLMVGVKRPDVIVRLEPWVLTVGPALNCRKPAAPPVIWTLLV